MKSKLSIAVILFDEVNAIDVAGPIEAFSCVRTETGEPAYTIDFWALGELAVRTESGLKLCADLKPPERPIADILIVPGGKGIRLEPTLTPLSGWLRAHHESFGRIASICTGVYALAEAGVLDGREVTTHWAHANDLQDRYPELQVRPDALYLQDGRFYSSGGVTAGIDLALDLIEDDFGSDAAMRVARELVVFLKRTGAQAQFSMPLQMQSGACDRLNEVCKWAASHLDADLSVDALASPAGLSSRQFARRFREAFGTPPAAYMKRLRLDGARTLLSQGVSLSRAANVSGFGSTDGFRRAFEGQFGVTPREYGQRFEQRGVPQ